jgi:hypothetical protein
MLYQHHVLTLVCTRIVRSSGGGGLVGNNGGVVEESDDQHQVNGDGATGQILPSRCKERI